MKLLVSNRDNTIHDSRRDDQSDWNPPNGFRIVYLLGDPTTYPWPNAGGATGSRFNTQGKIEADPSWTLGQERLLTILQAIVSSTNPPTPQDLRRFFISFLSDKI